MLKFTLSLSLELAVHDGTNEDSSCRPCYLYLFVFANIFDLSHVWEVHSFDAFSENLQYK